jgi:hypothetical protein
LGTKYKNKMERKIIIAIAAMLSSLYANGISLDVYFKDALNIEGIQFVFTAEGGHIGNTLRINATSTLIDTFDVIIPPGTQFNNDNPIYQGLIVTKKEVITIYPKTMASKLVKAMCNNQGKLTPIKNGTLTYVENNNPSTLLLCKYIDSFNIQNFIGQQAIWLALNNRSLTELTGGILDQINIMRWCLATSRNCTFDTAKFTYEYGLDPLYRKTRGSNLVQLGNNGKIILDTLKANDIVKIKVYDADGKYLRDIGFESILYGSSKRILNNISVGGLKEFDFVFVRLEINNTTAKEWMIEAS